MIKQPKNKKFGANGFTGELKFKADFSKLGNKHLHEAQMICDSEVVRLNDNYIRFMTGELRRSFQRDTILGSGVYMSNSPYAIKDYYNEGVTPSVVRMPLTGGLHFERMKNRHYDEIEEKVAKGVDWSW